MNDGRYDEERRSVDFFKRAAKARRVSYQRMIRALVDAYAEKQKGSEAVRRRHAHVGLHAGMGYLGKILSKNI